MTEIRPIQWSDGKLWLLDQTRLPMERTTLEIDSCQKAVDAIREMRVRGAPAIGVTAAYAMVLAAQEIESDDASTFLHQLRRTGTIVSAARPTAVNLQWAVQRMLSSAADECGVAQLRDKLLEEARRIQDEDEAINRHMGDLGKDLIPDGGSVLTHCNTGALATSGFGTALGVIRASWEAGNRFQVYNTETRPFLQGARLTSWELQQLGIPATLIVDSAAGMMMAQGKITCVITGADRIAANGDTANKIGTYSLAVLARENSIPFYVAAPISTIDLELPSGEEIQIEERSAEEVTHFSGNATAPDGVPAINPAFDVTPNRYISAIISEGGVSRPPYLETLLLATRSGRSA